MLPKRIYKVLVFLEKQTDFVDRLETDFTESDFEGLEKQGYVEYKELSVFDDEGRFANRHHPGYKITSAGRDALELHDLEEARYAESRKISKSSRLWAIIAAVISFTGIIVSILLGLLL